MYTEELSMAAREYQMKNTSLETQQCKTDLDKGETVHKPSMLGILKQKPNVSLVQMPEPAVLHILV